MRFTLFISIVLLSAISALAQNTKPTVYLIPGQGADQRLFKNLHIDSAYPTIHIKYFTPEKGWKMNDFAKALSAQIDTTEAFILLGVSLGGMLSVEMNNFLKPEKTIIISSAKTRNEFPFGYRLQKTIPFYKIIPKKMIKSGARFFQPRYEPISKTDTTFMRMLEAKDPAFLKRTIHMIMKWDKKVPPKNVVHIHGDNDHTIPIKNIDYNYLIKGGSHMMVLTKGKEISTLVNSILNETEP